MGQNLSLVLVVLSRAWVSNARPTRLCYVARGHICNLCTYCLTYADDVNILGGSAHTVKENAEALLVATKRLD